jgi:hypothetical protein
MSMLLGMSTCDMDEVYIKSEIQNGRQ